MLELFNQVSFLRRGALEKNLLKTPFINKYTYVFQYINISAVIVP